MALSTNSSTLDTLSQEEISRRVWEGANHGLRINGVLVAEFWSVQEDFLFNRVQIR